MLKDEQPDGSKPKTINPKAINPKAANPKAANSKAVGTKVSGPRDAESKAAVTKGKNAARARTGSRRLIYVGFESALDFWRGDTRFGVYEDCIDPDGELSYCDGFDPSIATSRIEDLADILEPGRYKAIADGTKTQPASDCRIEQAGNHAVYPVDVLVKHGTGRGCSTGVRAHQVRTQLPARSFVRGRHGVRIASPELVFLEMTTNYSLVELVKLGMELCGTYALSANDPDGFVPRIRICSVGRIKRYLGWCKGIRGLEKARLAASMLMDCSNSPLESKVMLGLTMPPRFGGLGLRKPALNQRRETTWLQAQTIGEHAYYFDAQWTGTLASGQRFSVDCEIDSKAHFNDPGYARSDVMRKDNVQYMRSTHISISSDEFCDVEAFSRKGLMIAKLIGQRICRYPRRGSPEEQMKFQKRWRERLGRLGDLLAELSHDTHGPRFRSM